MAHYSVRQYMFMFYHKPAKRSGFGYMQFPVLIILDTHVESALSPENLLQTNVRRVLYFGYWICFSFLNSRMKRRSTVTRQVLSSPPHYFRAHSGVITEYMTLLMTSYVAPALAALQAQTHRRAVDWPGPASQDDELVGRLQ